MLCEQLQGGGVEIMDMPTFFAEGTDVETSYAHVHSFYEIVWYKAGEGTHYVDFSEFAVHPNAIFFISPGQVHSFDKRHDQCGYVIKICSDLLNDALGEATYLKFDLFNTDSTPLHYIDDVQAEKMERILLGIRSENLEPELFGHKTYLSLLIRMLIIMIERGRKTQEPQMLNHTKVSHRTFLAFRQLVERDFRTKHTVKDYANTLHVTSKTLTNYTRECSPMTPLEIINERILLEAKRELRYSNRMIKEIGYSLGFEDPSYFIKFFKRQAKMLPIEFRESYILDETITPKQRPVKIAIPTCDGQVAERWGQTDCYTIVEITHPQDRMTCTIPSGGAGSRFHHQVARQLQEMGITEMWVGTIGSGALNRFSSCGIRVLKGCTGEVGQLVEEYLLTKQNQKENVY